ncbi:PAS domain S-box protein [Flavobacterium sp.]|uniref:PAS domain S-box protein n=1 Tax=Flavobacterium sp. TaxID=239 RepID=UPI002C195D1E|nr:PAS domain S-box protein [Flavobacterium sp.]HSD07420.1 PAS domain S-box protein [Flavobacterium sp.]
MSNTPDNKHYYFLSGGGEMGELMRAKDWGKTSLGTPDTWPQSLRTALSIILNSKFPMFIWWGSELNCFYNDAYRPSLGNNGKHPHILGQKAEEAWSEIWPIIYPLIEQVLTGNGATWSEDQLIPIYRNGKIEDVYWTFGYSPIYDESEKIAGVLVVCNETTENVKTLKKLEESNNRYLNNIIQAPTAMCVYRGENHIIEIANEQMLSLWGKKMDEILNKPIVEALPETKEQGLQQIIHNVFTTGKRYTANERSTQIIRNGKPETIYINYVYDALKESDGTISGVVAIAVEVTPHVVSRTKIAESEHKVRAIVENAPFPIAVYVGEEMRIEMANESIIAIWGKGNNVIGKSFMDVLPELDNQLVFEQIKAVYRTGQAFHTKNTPLDLIVDGKLGKYYFNYSLTPLYDVKGKIYGVMNTGVDLTDLNVAKKKIEESDKRFRNTVKQAPVGITILRGPEYIAEMANEAYLKLIDKVESSFVGKPLFDSLPEAKDSVSRLLNDVYNTGNPYHGNEVPIPINRYGKTEICFFDFLYYPLKEIDGEISGIIVTVTEVTEKVGSRKKTEQNEERLNIIVEASELGTYEVNLKNNEYTYSYRLLEIIGGYPNFQKLTQQELLKHIHPDDMHIRNTAFTNSLTSGSIHYESRVIWLDGSIHWMELKGKVFYDNENIPDKILGTTRDITNEKNHQQELEESEQKFRLLADSMPQHIWISDPSGKLTYYNQSVYEYTGLTFEEIEKGGLLQIVHPDDLEANIKTWKESLASGHDFLFEHRFRRHDGQYRWQLSRAIPQIDENGKIQMWVGTSTDIQEQKIFANELEKQVKERTKELSLINESLEKSEERYHLMVEEIQDYSILYLNHQGIIENWNLGAEKINGYKAEEVIGKNFDIFFTESDRKNNLPGNLLKTAIEKGKAVQEGWRMRKNKTLFWANIVITAVYNKKKELIGFSKVTHDLTDKKEADDKLKLNGLELQQKNAELEKMNKELQSFAYISSHDLQEPLRKIQTFASQIIAKESDNLSETGKDKFRRMQNAAQRMQALINDLLTYSKTNIQELKYEKTNLYDLIEEVKEDLAEELEQKNAVIETDEVCRDINLKIIPFQFRQLLYNLLSNSIKFSKPDINPLIKIQCKIAKGSTLNNNKLTGETNYCHLQVSDNGIGFEQEFDKKIFEVFQRLHGKTEYDGTGIGLAIVKKIVENHSGIISATSQQNMGATFDIYIPFF